MRELFTSTWCLPDLAKKSISPGQKQLWKAADKLRKNIDAAEYKHVVLGLIFLKFLKGNTADLTPEEQKGRIDIGYQTISDEHVIIELKRASVSIPVDKLMAQIRKYRSGAQKILATSNYKDWPLKIICLLGKQPPEWNNPNGPKEVADTLKTIDARIIYYDQLVDNAQQTYASYLEEHKKKDKLWGVFKSIDDFGVEPNH